MIMRFLLFLYLLKMERRLRMKKIANLFLILFIYNLSNYKLINYLFVQAELRKKESKLNLFTSKG